MKKSILIPVLTIVLCAVLLFCTAYLAEPVYLENTTDQYWTDLQTLLPGAESFTQDIYHGEDANIRFVYKADIGYVFMTQTYGYAGPITVWVGVSNEGKVTGLVVRDLSETVGLGANALTDVDFLSQFLNGGGSFAIGAPGADAFSGATGEEATGEEIYVDGISGATVTSKAIARCVNSAIGYVTGADVSSGATSWGG